MVDFLLEIALAARGKAVSLPASGSIFFGNSLDPTFSKQATKRAIECASAEEYSAMAHLPHITEDCVSVARFLGQAEQDEKHGFGDGK